MSDARSRARRSARAAGTRARRRAIAAAVGHAPVGPRAAAPSWPRVPAVVAVLSAPARTMRGTMPSETIIILQYYIIKIKCTSELHLRKIVFKKIYIIPLISVRVGGLHCLRQCVRIQIYTTFF